MNNAQNGKGCIPDPVPAGSRDVHGASRVATRSVTRAGGDEIGLAIIGGGPAGLMCAIAAAGALRTRDQSPGNSQRTERRVVVFEKMPRPGVKLLATGSGRCNITHSGDIGEFPAHYGDHGRFTKPALFGFTNADLLEFFRPLGLSFTAEESGKVFPESGQSRDVLEALLAEAARLGVEIIAGQPVRHIVRDGERYILGLDGAKKSGTGSYGPTGERNLTDSASPDCLTGIANSSNSKNSNSSNGSNCPGQSILARAICIATGGASYPGTGSSGDGYSLATSLGHVVVNPVPCLAPVMIRPWIFAECSGYSLRARKISVFREGKQVGQGLGDILFTHLGLSGPGILDLSRAIEPGDTLTFALMDDGIDAGVRLLKEIDAYGKREIKTILRELGLPENLALAIARRVGVDPSIRACELTRPIRKALGSCLGAFSVQVSSLGDFSQAKATRGGVDLASVNAKTMESRICPGLFFAGEVLDIDGDTGGYNLQAAFSTGHRAGISAAGQLCAGRFPGFSSPIVRFCEI